MTSGTTALIQKMAISLQNSTRHRRALGLSPVFPCVLVEQAIFVSFSVASRLCGKPALQVLQVPT